MIMHLPRLIAAFSCGGRYDSRTYGVALNTNDACLRDALVGAAIEKFPSMQFSLQRFLVATVLNELALRALVDFRGNH